MEYKYCNDATRALASTELIRRMIKDYDCDQFEDMRTMEQELTFDEVEKAFMWYNFVFTDDQ